MKKFDRIGTGVENAVRSNDRVLRLDVARANKSGDFIINVGTGYFRPDFSRKEEVKMAEHYMAEELHRAREILYKRLQMQNAMAKLKGEM